MLSAPLNAMPSMVIRAWLAALYCIRASNYGNGLRLQPLEFEFQPPAQPFKALGSSCKNDTKVRGQGDNGRSKKHPHRDLIGMTAMVAANLLKPPQLTQVEIHERPND